MSEKPKKILLVDGNNLLYSSYHVAQKLSWKIKQGTIFFFLRVIISFLKKNDYQKLLFFFDGGGTNFRKTLLPQYKAQREKMPEELWEQMEILKGLLEKSNLTYLQLVNCEADDLIASFITQNQTKDPTMSFDIFTRDKDLLQLLNKNVNILKYIDGKITLYTIEDFQQEYNFPPSHYKDYLSLIGDQVDNIAGIKGIGPVNAKNLIQQFGKVESIYQNIANLPTPIRKLIDNNQGLTLLNQKIISLKKNIPVPAELYQKCDFSWERLKNNQFLQNFCLENHFKSILKLLEN